MICKRFWLTLPPTSIAELSNDRKTEGNNFWSLFVMERKEIMNFTLRLLRGAIILSFLLGPRTALSDDRVQLEETFRIDRDQLVVDIDVDGAQVRINKNEKSDELFFRVVYNKTVCDAQVEFDEKENRLSIQIDHDHWQLIENNDEKKYADIEIRLPKKPQIDVFSKIKAGELDCDLGDLRITNLEVYSIAGRVNLDFSQPNRAQMENLDVNVQVGEVKLHHLGNANFKQADINGGMGSLLANFDGEYRDPCMAHIDLDVGETTLVLPAAIGVKLKVAKSLFLSQFEYPSDLIQKGSYYYSSNYSDSGRSIYLVISLGVGKLAVQMAP